jgi:hypothetical protein
MYQAMPDVTGQEKSLTISCPWKMSRSTFLSDASLPWITRTGVSLMTVCPVITTSFHEHVPDLIHDSDCFKVFDISHGPNKLKAGTLCSYCTNPARWNSGWNRGLSFDLTSLWNAKVENLDWAFNHATSRHEGSRYASPVRHSSTIRVILEKKMIFCN